jgi:hypothetical protein
MKKILFFFKKKISNLIKFLKKIRACAFYRKDTPEDTKKFLKYSQLFFLNETKIRKNFKTNEIDKELDNNGFVFKNLNDFDKIGSIKIFREAYNNIKWDLNNAEFKKNYLNIKFLDFTPNLINFANSFVQLATNYIGSLPILNSAQFWFSPNQIEENIGSQVMHLDPEDYRQLKIFIPIEDITLDKGPITFLNSNDSIIIYEDLIKKKKIVRRNSKITDETFLSYNLEPPIKGTINLNQFLALDTCRCWHYGSRKSLFPRKLMFLHFTSAFGGKCPLLFRSPSKNFVQKKDRLIYGYKTKMINHYSKLEYIKI